MLRWGWDAATLPSVFVLVFVLPCISYSGFGRPAVFEKEPDLLGQGSLSQSLDCMS